MRTSFKYLAAGLILAGAVSAAQADGLLKVEQTVFGMDCAPCAYGLRKGLNKLPGVSKVDVSLNDGKAVVEFAPGSPTSFTQIHDLIIHSGFTPQAAQVTVQGHLVKAGDHLRLIASATDEYDLNFPEAGAAAALQPDEVVVIEGQIAGLAAGAVPGLSVQKVSVAPVRTP
jgi:copper chaperone CopZ